MSIPLFGEPLQAKLPQRTLLLIARFGFSAMLIYTLFIFMPFHFTPLIFMLFHRKPFISTQLIFTLHRLMLHHRKLFLRKLFILTPLRFKQHRRQLLRPFSSYPAPQHRNQFFIAFPNPRKTNLFHSQIIQFLRPAPLS